VHISKQGLVVRDEIPACAGMTVQKDGTGMTVLKNCFFFDFSLRAFA